MDIFKRERITADMTRHGCPGVTVTIQQLSRADLLLFQAEERDGEAIADMLRERVEAISGLEAGGEPVETMARLMEVADAGEAIPGPVVALIDGITQELLIASSKGGSDLGNSQAPSDSGETVGDGTAPNAD